MIPAQSFYKVRCYIRTCSHICNGKFFRLTAIPQVLSVYSLLRSWKESNSVWGTLAY